MENLTQKSDFKSAYAAVRWEIESRRRPFSFVRTFGFAVVLIFTLEATRWLAFRFAFSGLEKTLLDFFACFLVMSVLLIVEENSHQTTKIFEVLTACP